MISFLQNLFRPAADPVALERARQDNEHRGAVLRRWLTEGRQVTMLCGDSQNIDLRPGERLVAHLPDTNLHEPRAVRTYQAGSRGTSVRIMKGVSIRVGGTRGQSQSHDVVQVVDSGDFIITNKRVIFCGSRRTITIRFDEIVGSVRYADGLQINKDGRDKPFSFTFNAAFSTTIDGATYYATGNFIDCILDQAKILARCPPDVSPADFMRTRVQVEVQVINE